jgi:hypothetical protein
MVSRVYFNFLRKGVNILIEKKVVVNTSMARRSVRFWRTITVKVLNSYVLIVPIL